MTHSPYNGSGTMVFSALPPVVSLPSQLGLRSQLLILRENTVLLIKKHIFLSSYCSDSSIFTKAEDTLLSYNQNVSEIALSSDNRHAKGRQLENAQHNSWYFKD